MRLTALILDEAMKRVLPFGWTTAPVVMHIPTFGGREHWILEDGVKTSNDKWMLFQKSNKPGLSDSDVNVDVQNYTGATVHIAPSELLGGTFGGPRR